jgi:ATP-dependent Clp protease, protease subunit
MEDAFQGQSTEIHLAVTEVMKDNIRVQEEMAKLCGQPLVKIKEDMKRDFYLTAAEAAAYGVIDTVMMPQQVRKKKKTNNEH